MSRVPIIVLREGTETKREREARQQNIRAMTAIAETVKSTMGPKGMDKMLVDSVGDITITNDGAEILDKLDIENVSARMMVNLADSIDEEIGDGTTSVVVFCAKLLENALDLVEQDLHPKPIITGYKLAADKSARIIEEIAETISKDDETLLKGAAVTAMNSKDIAAVKEYFSELALKAVKHVAERNEGPIFPKVDNIKIIKAPGQSLRDSELITGVYIDKEKVSPNMPDVLNDVKIAVIRKKLEISKGEYESQVKIDSPEKIQEFLDHEKGMLKDYLKYFKDLGVDVVVNSQSISDKFGSMLGKEGIAAIKNVGNDDIESVLNATGATLIDNLKDLKEEHLGYAQKVKFEKIGGSDYTLFTGCKSPQTVAILLKGGLDKILSTAEIAFHDVVSILAKIIDTKRVVAGGGATYIEIAKRLRSFANEVSGKEQLAIQAFANALEEIPRTLIRNAGLDEIERMTELRAAHKTPEDKWIGIDTIDDTIGNNMEKGIIEPAALIKHLTDAGSELSRLILRVDRIINSKSAESE